MVGELAYRAGEPEHPGSCVGLREAAPAGPVDLPVLTPVPGGVASSLDAAFGVQGRLVACFARCCVPLEEPAPLVVKQEGL